MGGVAVYKVALQPPGLFCVPSHYSVVLELLDCTDGSQEHKNRNSLPFEGVGQQLAQRHFLFIILLAKASLKANPDFRGWEIGSISQWEEWRGICSHL